MGRLIDTNLLIDLERSRGDATQLALPLDEHFVSVVTVSELFVGAFRGAESRRKRRLMFAEHVFSRLVVLDIDQAVARLHAQLTAEMFALGRPPGINDLWIAATAIHHDLEVLTRDARSFPHIPSIRIAQL